MQLNGHSFFLLVLYSNLAFLAWAVPAWLAMRLIAPRVIVERYLREPHFTSAEIIIFSHFPGSLARTMIFVIACIRPSWGTKRRITDIVEHAPRWYVLVARVLAPLMLGHAVILLLLSI